jgi:CBS domain-containing protein
MEHIHDLVKDREVYFVETGRTILETVRYMVERNIGAVAVISDEKLVGIFSERDLMKRVVGEGRDPSNTSVRDVMTSDPLVVSPNERITDCMRLMKENSFRHLPVCDGRKLIGLISLRDLILHDLTVKEGEVEAMRAYLTQAS